MSVFSAAGASARLGRISVETVSLFICDIQEVFRDKIHEMPAVINTASLLLKTAKVLEIPTIVTEQYSARLGKSVAELEIPEGEAIDKRKFSMLTDEVKAKFEGFQRKSVILVGIEVRARFCASLNRTLSLHLFQAHVCILQTCIDLIDQGFEVHIVCDGVSSQRAFDRKIALQVG
jgi:nicotinamidase-related amidase